MTFKLAISLLFLTLSAPALADEVFAVTPSGAAEMLFPSGQSETVNSLAGKCIDASWTVISSTATELVCEAPMNFGQTLVGQLLMGNSYSTPPRRFFRFNVAENNGISRVQASGWMELQMAFGQMKRTDFSGPEFQNSITTFMGSAGGSFPAGTTFPNHVFLGVQFKDAPRGKAAGLQIIEIMSGSAAENAGLQVGDVVTKVAGKSFKNGDDLLDASAKAAKNATYQVEYYRAGELRTATLERVFRAPVVQTVVAESLDRAAPLSKAQPGQVTSVADELAKLVKLKEQGVLSDTEFDSLKQKLIN